MPTFTGNDGDNTLTGSDEADTISGLEGADRLSGNGGDDTIDGGSGNDDLSGGANNDTMDGGIGGDVLAGGTGSDTLVGGDDRDFLFGNQASTATAVLPFDSVVGPPPHYFSLTGDSEADVLNGGAGNDVIVAGYGDTVDGGADGASLYVSYLGAPHGVSEGGGSGFAHLTVSNVQFSGWLQGSNFADTLGGNWILGMGGDDEIIGHNSYYGAYYNFYDGGDGNDHIKIYALDGSIGAERDEPLKDHPIDPGRVPFVFGGRGDDTIIGRGIIDGGEGNDTLRGGGETSGGAGSDVIHGGAYNDTLSAGSAVSFDTGTEIDQLHGWGGDDMMFAGFGDIVDGGDGFDTVGLSYVGASHGIINGDTAILRTGQPLAPGGGTIQNVERYSDIQLTQFSDKMVIGDQADPATVRSWDGDDHLTGQEMSITMYGGNGHDLLVGGTSADVLYGEAGNDKLIGHTGKDDLWGGAGSDTFFFTVLGATDRINDFERGADKIDLTGIDADSSTAGHQAFKFIDDALFTGKAGELRIYDAGNDYYVLALDVDGDRNSDLLIELGSVRVGSADFIL